MKRERDLTKSGEALVQHAEEQLRATRGTVGDLFPYIYEAAGRMSTRAIAKFLETEERIALSPSTVLRAVRHADEYFDAYLDEVEAALETLKETYGAEGVMGLIEDEEEFRAEHSNPPWVAEGNAQQSREMQIPLEEALQTLAESWWVGGPRYRREALRRLRKRLAGAPEEKPQPAKAAKRRK